MHRHSREGGNPVARQRLQRQQEKSLPTDSCEMKQPAVYLLASQRNGTLYVGVTSNLIQRIWQHREGSVDGFSRDYAVKTLVWYEMHVTMESAIRREKALKKWNRAWKLKLIEESNAEWIDLWPEINGEVT